MTPGRDMDALERPAWPVVTEFYGWFVAEPGWVVLAYRMPREPSAPRVTVWRKLRRLGSVQLVDGLGLVALPNTPETVKAFDWLADEVIEVGDEAWTWRAAGSKQHDNALRQQLRAAVVEEYVALIAEVKDAGCGPQRRTVQRLRRMLHDIERRHYVAPRERDDAHRAVQRPVESWDAVDEQRRRALLGGGAS